MSKTNELRKELTSILREICPRVYYGQAEKTTARPYIIYTVEQIALDDDQHMIEVEMNVVDYGTDTSECEEIADRIETRFHKNYFINDKIQFSSYVERRQPVEEEDKRIIRRRIVMEIHLYERSA